MRNITVEEAKKMALATDGEYTKEFEEYLNKNGIALDCWDYSDLAEFFESLGYEPV